MCSAPSGCAPIAFAPSSTFSQHQQDRLPLDEPPARPALTHENVRGATYYEEVYADPSHD